MTRFPEDLLIEILSLLPVVTLIQFRCVCKSWYALLQSPSFISKHVSNADNNVGDDHHRLIVAQKDLINDRSHLRILSYNTFNVLQADFMSGLSGHGVGGHYPRLLGCYSGLVCLTDDIFKEVAFWNPATRQFKAALPKLTYQQRVYVEIDNAFGYDFRTNDYKVMRVVTAISKGPPYRIEVYSFNAGSWRASSAVIPDGLRFHHSYERLTVCVKGISSTLAYIEAKKGEVPEYFLFTFDMSNEAFIVTGMPETLEHETPVACYWRHKPLTELNGSVSFIKQCLGPNRKDESFTVFVLNEYGCNGSWTKLYSIPPLYKALWNRFSPTYPIGFWKNGDLFIDIHEGDLVLCDGKTREFKKIEIGGRWRQYLEYKESLVWINDGNDHSSGRKKMYDHLVPGTINE